MVKKPQEGREKAAADTAFQTVKNGKDALEELDQAMMIVLHRMTRSLDQLMEELKRKARALRGGAPAVLLEEGLEEIKQGMRKVEIALQEELTEDRKRGSDDNQETG